MTLTDPSHRPDRRRRSGQARRPHDHHRTLVLAVVLTLATMVAAGCLQSAGSGSSTVREIRMWVEQMEWELHPGVTTTVWAFCAEGDGVEPVHGEGEEPCGVPGPTIRVNEGDTIRLTFENTHSIPHTVHFHGWHPFETDMNGAAIIDDAMVVRPGATATIEWTAEPAGTFIYHCHFETPAHMDMGMYGAFIVEPPRALSDDGPDAEFVQVLDEWSVHNGTAFDGPEPFYNYFTINGRSFPLTAPLVADPGDRVRIHLVNAGFQFRAMHLHGYTPRSWEGVAGPRHAVPTDVRAVAPGQSVVLELLTDREGVWLLHDHVVPKVTAGATGAGFGAYPRGMLTVLVVGSAYLDRVQEVAPVLLDAARGDAPAEHRGGQGGAGSGTVSGAGDGNASDGVLVEMKNIEFQPATITVPAGTTVTWENRDGFVHTVTADDGSFDSGDIAAGASWSFTFDQPGTYAYHCIPHAYQDDDGTWRGMVGTVVVEAA